MPRYFFDVTENGLTVIDVVGSQLHSIDAARLEATRAMTDMGRDYIPGDGLRQSLSIVVRDDADRAVVELSLVFDTKRF